MLKRDLVRENTKLGAQAKKDAATISKLTTNNGEFKNAVTKSSYDAMKYEKDKEIEELKLENENLGIELEKVYKTFNTYAEGRIRFFLEIPWYKRIFLKTSTIRNIIKS